MDQHLAEGTIVKAYTTVAGNGRSAPAMIFDVRLDAAADFGFMTPELERVPVLTAGFAPIVPSQEHYTGIVFAPEVGARVLVGRTSRGAVIMGFLTGPTSVNASENPELTSYNPGIDTAVARTVGTPGKDDVPIWALGLSPGDVSIGKFTARFKINDFGCFAGANASCFTHHGFGGNRIEKWMTRDERGLGYWRVSRALSGHLTSNAVYSSGLETAPGACWTVEAYDSDPDPIQMAPYVLNQHGFIPNAMADAGKGSAEMAPMLSDVVLNRLAGKTVVQRLAVIHPLNIPTTPIDEIIAPVYDSRVNADGSWRIRSGNRADAPVWVPAFELSFDTASGAFSLVIGDVASQQVVISARNGAVKAICASLVAEVLGDAEISARSVQIGGAEVIIKSASTVQVQAPNTIFTGDVSIAGALVVGGALVAGPLTVPTVTAGALGATVITAGAITAASVVAPVVMAGTISLATHVHIVPSTGPTVTLPPS